MNSFEDLRNQIALCMEIAPTKVIDVFAEVLQERDVRVLMAAVGKPIGAYPQVQTTVSLDDVSATTVAQVVTPILMRLGLPDHVVPMAAGAAAAFVSRYLDSIRKSKQ